MKFVSTRNSAKELNFEEVVLQGLASDGGLYVPASLPKFSDEEIKNFKKLSYPELFFEVTKYFIDGEIPEKTYQELVNKSYKKFSHSAIAPLKQLDDKEFLLELFHGPTLSFKDYSLQVVGNLFEHVLKKEKKRITIIGATSGDTGSAAINACKNKSTMELFIFHPYKKVSNIQRRLMTTVKSKNIHNIAIRGNFDDCQKIVKKLFVDEDLKNKFYFSAINSINWARILFQIIYYFLLLVQKAQISNFLYYQLELYLNVR